jgi:hypothetical protein
VVHAEDLTASAGSIRVPIEVEGGGAMPKKYRIEMTLLVDDTDAKLDSKTHKENYEDDAEARQQFAKKSKAAEDTAKGSRPE